MKAMNVDLKHAKEHVGNIDLQHIPGLLESRSGHDEFFELSYKDAMVLSCTMTCFRELEDALIEW